MLWAARAAKDAEVLSTEIPTDNLNLAMSRPPVIARSTRRDLHATYLAFRLVFRAGAAIRNVARSVQATSAESELQ